MSVTVYLSTHMDSYTGGRTKVEAQGSTLFQIMADLERHYPGLRFRIIDEQNRIRRHINVFVGAERAEDLSHTVTAGEEIHILAALSGG